MAVCAGKSERRLARASSADRFLGPEQEAPAIGGLVDLRAPHSDWLLPPEVVLFEPSERDIFSNGTASKHGGRQIFLNTPLSEAEVAGLGELRRTWRASSGGRDELPEYVGLHALRVLQQCKFNATKAVDMMRTMLRERVKRLPIAEADVLADLKRGFMYWHGRDRLCRPCLVIRLERLGTMARDKERAVRLVLFVLEYAIRFAMVPGRVENWVVVLDLANALNVVSPLHLGSMVSTALALATALETVYCGRMAFMKIVNLPGSSILLKAVNGAIPAEKKDKVSFPLDVAAEMATHFEADQLEARYGGAAPDVAAEETYPFRFLPGARGPAGSAAAGSSLHGSASRAFHEGALWDSSSPEAIARWLLRAQGSSLTPAAAAALGPLLPEGARVEPCRDLARWRELAGPAPQRGRQSVRSLTAILRHSKGTASDDPWA